MTKVEMIVTTEGQPGSQHVIVRDQGDLEDVALAAARVALGARPTCTVVGLGHITKVADGKVTDLEAIFYPA